MQTDSPARGSEFVRSARRAPGHSDRRRSARASPARQASTQMVQQNRGPVVEMPCQAKQCSPRSRRTPASHGVPPGSRRPPVHPWRRAGRPWRAGIGRKGRGRLVGRTGRSPTSRPKPRSRPWRWRAIGSPKSAANRSASRRQKIAGPVSGDVSASPADCAKPPSHARPDREARIGHAHQGVANILETSPGVRSPRARQRTAPRIHAEVAAIHQPARGEALSKGGEQPKPGQPGLGRCRTIRRERHEKCGLVGEIERQSSPWLRAAELHDADSQCPRTPRSWRSRRAGSAPASSIVRRWRLHRRQPARGLPERRHRFRRMRFAARLERNVDDRRSSVSLNELERNLPPGVPDLRQHPAPYAAGHKAACDSDAGREQMHALEAQAEAPRYPSRLSERS